MVFSSRISYRDRALQKTWPKSKSVNSLSCNTARMKGIEIFLV